MLMNYGERGGESLCYDLIRIMSRMLILLLPRVGGWGWGGGG